MIWLIGNKGMLGTDVECLLKLRKLPFTASDLEIDITEKSQLINFIDNKKLDNIDCIINCSAYTAVDKAEDESELAFKINRDGVKNLSEIAKEKDITLIHISTDYVFNGEKKDAYLEVDSTNPAGIYGKSKLDGESAIINTINNYYIIRTAWLYGKNGNNFVHTMLKAFGERDTVNVVADQFGSPTYTKDLASAVIDIAQFKNLENPEYGIYHFTNEGKASWYEFAEQIYLSAKEEGMLNGHVEINPITTDQYPTKAKRPKYSYLSKEKIKNVFNLFVRNWQDALKEFLKELKNSEKTK